MFGACSLRPFAKSTTDLSQRVHNSLLRSDGAPVHGEVLCWLEARNLCGAGGQSKAEKTILMNNVFKITQTNCCWIYRLNKRLYLIYKKQCNLEQKSVYLKVLQNWAFYRRRKQNKKIDFLKKSPLLSQKV